MIKVAIFSRVSLQNMNNDRQISDLTQYAITKGYEIVAIIEEKISGVKAIEERKGISNLLQLASDRKINKVLVSEISRIGRNPGTTLSIIDKLTAFNVSVHIRNMDIDTIDEDGRINPNTELILSITSQFAKQERMVLIQRINSGLARAKSQGIILGRKKGSIKSKEVLAKEYQKVIKCLREGISIRNTAKICDVSAFTAQRVKNMFIKV